MEKMVYTTGEVARICNLSQQTVIRCFDRGEVGGYRVPGSRFRRIPREQLIRFMRANNMPLDRLLGGKRRVLVVDDNVQIIEMLQELLVKDGPFDVRSAVTGYEAGLLTRSFNPDILLLDYMLPDVNGHVVCASIRREPELSHIKIIMMSGVVDPDQIEKLMEAGADRFIRKPFPFDVMKAAIAELLHL